MGITRFTIVRHGETEWNVQSRLQGHRDSELTEKGVSQAKKIAQSLKGSKFDCIYSSDLKRAHVTAQFIADAIQMEVHKAPSFRERSFGDIEGMTQVEFASKFPEQHARLSQGIIHYEIPGSESLPDFQDRIVEAFESLAKKHEGQHILVVAHGGILDCMVRKIFNVPYEAPRCYVRKNTSKNVLQINDKGQWILESWGEVGHLDSEKSLDDL